MPRPRSVTATVSFVRGRVLSPWRVEWRAFDDQLGKRRRYTEHVATEAEADARKTAIDGAVLRDATKTAPMPATTTGPVTFRAHAAEWLEKVISRKKPGTEVSYQSALRLHINPILGDVLVTPRTLTALEITAVITACTKAGMTWGHQLNMLRIIGACLRWAVKWQRLPANPAQGLSLDLKDENWDEPQPNPFTRDQIFAFLHWVRTNGRELPADYRAPDRPVARKPRDPRGAQLQIAHWYPYFLLLFSTGMRRNEGSALQWDDVFLDTPGREKIRVRWSYSKEAERAARRGDTRYPISGLIKPKTKAGLRDLTDLPRGLIDVLRELARTRRALALEQRRAASPFVILGTRGQQLTHAATVDRIFAAGMAALGLVDVGHTVHDLRDTFATLHLIDNQGSLLRISRMLGHAKPTITLTRYAKWVDYEAASPAFASVLEQPARVLPLAKGAPRVLTTN